MLQDPRVYVSGLKKMHLNIRKMLEWILHALVLSAVVFWITFASIDVNGQWDTQYVLLCRRSPAADMSPCVCLEWEKGLGAVWFIVFACVAAWLATRGLSDGMGVAGMAVYTVLIFAMQLKVGCLRPWWVGVDM